MFNRLRAQRKDDERDNKDKGRVKRTQSCAIKRRKHRRDARRYRRRRNVQL